MTTAEKKAPGDRKFRVVGTRPIRPDGLGKVTGSDKYGGDVRLPGMLHGRMLRSPHAHARIKKIDVRKAEALPGVKAVITAKDFPEIPKGEMNLGETAASAESLGENAMASKKVLYKGHAVAAVAATTPHIAEEALDLIEVDYEVLPPILDLREAMVDGSPLIHENQTTKDSAAAFAGGADSGVKSNIASHLQFKNGDIEEGFKQADIIVEREFTTQPVHQGYIELHNSTAQWKPDGHLTIWTSTQSHFGIRTQTAALLGIPESTVKVVPMEIGGGFGGKISTYFDHVAALLSKKTGAPVQIIMNRKEVFEGTGPASGSYMRFKAGVTKEGKLTAAELYLAFEAGGFPGSAVGAGAMCGLAPYKIEHLLIDGYDIVVNKPKVAAYRAPGAPQAAYAVETVMDELAEKLGMDAMDFRLKNASREGDRQAMGVPFGSIGCVEVEEAIKNHPHYKSKLTGPNRGRGVAMGFWFNVGFQSSATINVNTDGTISLITGSVDIGGTRASVSMQAAEILGIAAEDVFPSVGDTDSVGWTGVTGGSRTAFSTGIAAINAAEEVIKIMAQRAAVQWETQPDEVEFKEGVFFSQKNPEDRKTFKELAAAMMMTGGPITASASSNPKGVGSSFSAFLVDVEVDPETGKVDVLRATVFQDVGKAAHPSYVEGQMQGGSVQGIGWALNEEYFYTDDGTMANSSFLDYRIPTSLDLPAIDAEVIEVPNPGHPFGLRGVGECSIVPPMAAMANAIYDAIGVRMSSLPMSPGAILKALAEKDGS